MDLGLQLVQRNINASNIYHEGNQSGLLLRDRGLRAHRVAVGHAVCCFCCHNLLASYRGSVLFADELRRHFAPYWRGLLGACHSVWKMQMASRVSNYRS
jgi:hypothetical protein